MIQSAPVPAPPGLPELSSVYPLTAEQIESFRTQGHVLLRGVCSPEEVAAYRGVIVEASRNLNAEKRKLEERDTYGKAFLQTLNLRLQSEDVRKFVLSPRFGRIGAELMGVDGVRIFHEQSLFKEPGGGLTPWHQDQYYWPLEGLTTLGMWMPLVDCSEEMGVLTFASGTHRAGFLGQNKISDESQTLYNKLIEEKPYPVAATAMKRRGALADPERFKLVRKVKLFNDALQLLSAMEQADDDSLWGRSRAVFERVQDKATELIKGTWQKLLDSQAAKAETKGPQIER